MRDGNDPPRKPLVLRPPIAPPDAAERRESPSERPSYRAALLHSLVAPAPARPMRRGFGLVPALVASALLGAADGARTVAAPGGPALHGAAGALVVAHCVAVMLAGGLVVGLLAESLIIASARLVPLVRLWAWLRRGPRRWFARDASAAHRVLLAYVALAAAVVPVFPISRAVVTHFHSQKLMALAITLAVLCAVPFSAASVVLVAAPTRWAVHRARSLASPGAVLALGLAALLLSAGAFRAANRAWLAHLDWAAITLAAAFPVLDLLVLLGLRRRFVSAPLPRSQLALGLALVAAAAAASALTLSHRQVVAGAVAHRTALVSLVVQALEGVTDLDRDGRSALFNGGDCDDLDPAVHPGARDVPGNGVDENCFGGDARPLRLQSVARPAHPTGLPPGAHPSFLLVSVDTLRPDHLGAYGYRRPTSPHLDAFAAHAARFERAYTTTPRTLQSFATIWTGRFSPQTAWGAGAIQPPFEDSNLTLAEQLRDAGYDTAAFTDTDYFRQVAGFLQGFEEVHHGDAFKGDLDAAVDQAVEWIHGRIRTDAPFFGWLHLLEPHDPYRDLTAPQDFGHAPIDRYDEEIARADAALGRVFEAVSALRAQNPANPVVVIVTADHGEGLGEHRYPTHSFDLHEEVMRVPLIVDAPGVPAGPRAAVVSLVDLHATVLEYAGIAPRVAFASQSMIDVLRDPSLPFEAAEPRELVYGEVPADRIPPTDQKVLISPPYKLLWDVRAGTWELYDLVRDPGERRNLFDERPAVAGPLRERLEAWAAEVTTSRRVALLAAARMTSAPAPQRPVRARFDGVMELLGVDLESPRMVAGAPFRLTLYYRVIARTPDPLRVTLRLVRGDAPGGAPVLRSARAPLGGQYATTEWVAGEVLRDEFELRVQPTTRPAQTRIELSLTAAAAPGESAPSAAAPGTVVDLGELEVVAR